MRIDIGAASRALGPGQETLLAPLFARATAARQVPDLAFRDPLAESILARLHLEPGRAPAELLPLRGSVVRTKWFDGVARRFLMSKRRPLCVSLGSGLDGRPHRIGFSQTEDADWIDLELPEVAALRDDLIPALPRVQTRAGDLAEPGWIDRLPWSPGRPVLFLAEGVLMHLAPRTVQSVIAALCAAADQRQSAIELAFDYIAPLAVVRLGVQAMTPQLPSLGWLLEGPSELERDRLYCVEHYDLAIRAGWSSAVASLSHRLSSRGGRLCAAVRLTRSADAEDDRLPPATLAERLSPFAM